MPGLAVAKYSPRRERLQRERAVGHGDVDVVAVAGALRADERREQAGDAEQRAAGEVGDLHARDRRAGPTPVWLSSPARPR